MKDLSLYIHIPFCKTLCLYCNFPTYAHKHKRIPEYIKALKTEIIHLSKKYTHYQIETIYFGGGTPSQLPIEGFTEIVDTLRSHFTLTKKPEITTECNPESIDSTKIRKFKSLGINRISLGIQTLNKKSLLRIARPHDDTTIFKALNAIQTEGIQNFGVDLIMGLPYQTYESFKNEIETILTYNPAHVSAYFLSYDTKKIDLFIAECPNEDEQIQMYQWLVKRLKKAGLHHYEVSNYARTGYKCKHNMRYWKQKEYLGFGVGAHSYLNKKVWENTQDIESYIQNPTQKPESMDIDKSLDKAEFILLNLRTSDGINLTEYEKKFGDSESLIRKAQDFIESKHLAFTKHSLSPTDNGFLIIDHIVQHLI